MTAAATAKVSAEEQKRTSSGNGLANGDLNGGEKTHGIYNGDSFNDDVLRDGEKGGDLEEQPERITGSFAAATESAGGGGISRNSSRKKVLKASRTFDAYAIEPKPKTTAGGIITVIAWMCTLAYTGYTVYVWIVRPWVNNSTVQWTYTAGPWNLRTRCRAPSGCYISNDIDIRWAPNTGPGTQSACVYLKPGEWWTFNAQYSSSPDDGISIIYIPAPVEAIMAALPTNSTPNTTVPDFFGAEIESYLACGPGAPLGNNLPPCTDGAQQLLTPILYGISLLFYVETTNNSQSGRGSFRQEWYPSQVSVDKTIMPGMTTCDPVALALNSSWVQARLRMETQFVTVVVDRDALWIVVWGAVGGAMGLFLQIGAIVLSVVAISGQLLSKGQASGRF